MTVPAADNLLKVARWNRYHYVIGDAVRATVKLLEAIDALHQPIYGRSGKPCSCGVDDCPTARLLHGEDQ